MRPKIYEDEIENSSDDEETKEKKKIKKFIE